MGDQVTKKYQNFVLSPQHGARLRSTSFETTDESVGAGRPLHRHLRATTWLVMVFLGISLSLNEGHVIEQIMVSLPSP